MKSTYPTLSGSIRNEVGNLDLLGTIGKITGSQPVTITIISLLEYARQETEFNKYRKAILDACGMVKLIRESDVNA